MKKNSLTIFAVIIFSCLSVAFNTVYEFKQDDPWIADPSSKNLKNPVEASKSSIKKGKSIYNTRCVVCHGATGTGDGPGAKALKPKPANHTSANVQNQTDGELFWKLSEGRGAMMGWKNIISEEERWHLVNYIRTLKAEY